MTSAYVWAVAAQRMTSEIQAIFPDSGPVITRKEDLKSNDCLDQLLVWIDEQLERGAIVIHVEMTLGMVQVGLSLQGGQWIIYKKGSLTDSYCQYGPRSGVVELSPGHTTHFMELGGNVTLRMPNFRVGRTYNLIFSQDQIGGRTVVGGEGFRGRFEQPRPEAGSKTCCTFIGLPEGLASASRV